MFFQRKNEFFPQEQKSAFSKDVSQIQKKIKGSSYQFGFLHEHHFFLFHTDGDYSPEKEDQTLEVLMYDSRNVSHLSQQKIKELKEGLFSLFPGFEIQDHCFEDPSGYSANAVRGTEYYTLHITPNQPFFYISFETNMQELAHGEIIGKIRSLFGAETFDVISFTPRGFREPLAREEELSCCTFFHHVLKCGYQVVYQCFSENKMTAKSPRQILSEGV